MNRKINKFIEFLDLVDEQIGIGLGIDYADINESNIESLKEEFIHKFTVKYGFKDLLNQKILLENNINSSKSFMEILNEI